MSKFELHDFREYCSTQFRDDLREFFNSYHAKTRWEQNALGFKSYDSECLDSQFLDSELSDERKLHFITCLAYLLECEHKLFINPKICDYTFELCKSFCRALEFPLIYSGPGSGMMGARYQLNQLRLIPFDDERRAALREFITAANDCMKDVFRAIYEGRHPHVSDSESYATFMEECAKVYSSFDEFWSEVKKGLEKMQDIAPNTLNGYNVWIRRQEARPQAHCKAIEYWLDKTNGFKKDVDRLLLKFNKGFEFNKDICFTKLSDSEEKDVYFRACWTYLYAFVEAIDRDSVYAFARTTGYDSRMMNSVWRQFGMFDVNMGMTPSMTQKYLETLQEMSWEMEKFITSFLQGKSEVWSGNRDYQNFVMLQNENSDHIWEKILNHIEKEKTQVVRIEKTDNKISIQLSNFHFNRIDMVKVECDEGDFYIGKTLVTDSQFCTLMCQFSGSSDIPVTNVTLYGLKLFINRMSQITGLKFRLPTAKEWMFAAKGGKQSKGYRFAGSDNLEEVAWCRYNSDRKPHPVAKKKPNELGLYDMSGNMWEMTSEVSRRHPAAAALDPEFRSDFDEPIKANNLLEIPRDELYGYYGIDCGGCFHDKEDYCEISRTSTFNLPYINDDIMGFRLVCTE